MVVERSHEGAILLIKKRDSRMTVSINKLLYTTTFCELRR